MAGSVKATELDNALLQLRDLVQVLQAEAKDEEADRLQDILEKIKVARDAELDVEAREKEMELLDAEKAVANKEHDAMDAVLDVVEVLDVVLDGVLEEVGLDVVLDVVLGVMVRTSTFDVWGSC